MNEELDLLLMHTNDFGVFCFYTGKEVQRNTILKKGPLIYIRSLFGKYTLKKLHEAFVYNSVLECIGKIFSLRLVINSDQEVAMGKVISSLVKMK